MSHEEVNPWHRGLGWICYILLLSHSGLYLNYYFQVGGLTAALFRPVPVLGILGLLSMTLLSTTALGIVRHLSYRLFYVTHILVGLALPVVIWFHVPHARLFVAESLFCLLADISIRRFMSLTRPAHIEMLPGTDLIRITAKVPRAETGQFQKHPASHIYLSIPSQSRPGRNCLSSSKIALGLTANPFTVAAMNDQTRQVTLVARLKKGPMTNTLAKLASLRLPPAPEFHLRIDGPYGSSTFFPSWALSQFDSVLLIAGGIGMTFILPLYQHITAEAPSKTRVNLVWAVRNPSETSWPPAVAGETVFDDDRIRIFVTGTGEGLDDGAASPAGSSDQDLEMNRLEKNDDSDNGLFMDANMRYERPDLRGIIDCALERTEQGSVAVVVCGPARMAQDVRSAVAVWVRRGRDVWFHSEGFGW